MGWESVDVSTIQVIGKTDPIPRGRYTLQLMGAYESNKDPLDTSVLFKIVDNGPYQGRSVYVDLPDPDRLSWSTETYARIIRALGATVEPFKQPKDTLSELAKNGHSRLSADIYTKTFLREDGSEGTSTKVATRSFEPAA